MEKTIINNGKIELTIFKTCFLNSSEITFMVIKRNFHDGTYLSSFCCSLTELSVYISSILNSLDYDTETTETAY